MPFLFNRCSKESRAPNQASGLEAQLWLLHIFGSVDWMSGVPELTPLEASLVVLAKPSFTPPDWVFGPVWTTLYVLMALAVWRILRFPMTSGLTLFWGQLALNAAWSWIFFASRSPLLGLLDIIPQLLLIVATFVAFYRLDTIAALCLIPLIAWVTFAAVLNFGIWTLNS